MARRQPGERRDAVRMADRFELSGYGSDGAYQKREPDWDGDDDYESLDAALEDARSWVAGRDDRAVVEVIRVAGSPGEVTPLVSISGVEALSPKPFVVHASAVGPRTGAV